ncbi:MAG: hypothetical protein J5556_02500, partial [Deltaproteobacteria bacterium]|nr:hypothetical protein [Deltaproteobacteria bacterium]
MGKLTGYIDSGSGRNAIYGILLDADSPESRDGILEIEGVSYEIECSRFYESAQARYGHGNHGFRFWIPESLKDGSRHWVKLLDKATGTLVTEESILFRESQDDAQAEKRQASQAEAQEEKPPVPQAQAEAPAAPAVEQGTP